jgi:hypothetical protein
LQEYNRWLPRKKVPSYLVENEWIYVIDERWDTQEIPLQDVRGSLFAQPLLLDADGELAMPRPPAGTVVLAGTLRVILGKLEFVPVQTVPEPRLVVGGAVRAGAPAAAARRCHWPEARAPAAALIRGDATAIYSCRTPPMTSPASGPAFYPCSQAMVCCCRRRSCCCGRA